MKTTAALAFSLAATLASLAQSQSQSADNLNRTSIGVKTRSQIVERGAHHKKWENATATTNSLGHVSWRTNSWVELQTGMHQWRDGRWAEASDEILLTSEGAAATNTAFKVFFKPNINTAGSIDLTTPDGKRLKSKVAGLSYFDTSTGTGVLLAELKDSVGQIVGTNRVLYTNAFDDIQADCEYVVSKAGFEQNIVLREKLPDPKQFGLNPETTKLQALTEFFEPPQPERVTSRKGRSVTHESTLGFGKMKMVAGRAFFSEKGARRGEIGVQKQWQRLDGRDFLIEEVSFDAVTNQLSALPTPRQAGVKKAPRVGKGESILAAIRESIRQARPNKSTGSVQLAKATTDDRPGFVLDYPLVGYYTDYTLRGDTTYHVSGPTYLFGNSTIEGGTVVKSSVASSEGLVFGEDSGTITCKTAPYRPAVFTSRNDNKVGAIVDGSTGNPSSADVAAAIFTVIEYPYITLNNLRIRYAGTALLFQGPPVPLEYGYGRGSFTLLDMQITDCGLGVYFGGALYAGNVLFANIGTVLSHNYDDSTIVMEHVTAHNTGDLDIGEVNTGYSFTTNNCIFNCVPGYPCGTDVFAQVGAGAYYLPSNSPYRNTGNPGAGNPEISTVLKSLLEKKTTSAPIQITSPIGNLTPRSIRDNDGYLDMGYHYDPIDYAVQSMQLGGGLMVLPPGTVISTYGLNPAAYGIQGNMTLHGLPQSHCGVVSYETVQEGTASTWQRPQAQVVGTVESVHALWSVLADGGTHIGAGAPSGFDCRHSEFFGGAINCNGATGSIFDCLFHQTSVEIYSESGDYLDSTVLNSTFVGGTLAPWQDGSDVLVRNNVFHKTQFSCLNVIHDHNAYLTGQQRIGSLATGDVIVTDFGFVSGTFGDFYLPATSPLRDTAAESAASLGLFHYTTQQDNSKEAGSQADFGYHYLAVDSNGNPPDTDGDGRPDCIEDANGNGTTDIDETAFTDPDTDYDGITDTQELADGTNPLSPTSAAQVRLAYFDFNAPNWVGDRGQLPRAANLIEQPTTWSGSGLRILNQLTSRLVYNDRESDGRANINLRQGTVRFWFKPDWSSTTAGGNGPQVWSRIIELGRYATGWGHWALDFNPQGTLLRFHTSTAGGPLQMLISQTISWSQGKWYQVCLTYGPQGSKLYINGQLASSGGAVQIQNIPSAQQISANGLIIGNSGQICEPVKGTFDELETFNYQLTAATILGNYMSICSPRITLQPVNQSVDIGASASFQAVAAGFEPLVYQWKKNGVALVDDGHVSGSTSATLHINAAQTADAACYVLEVSNECGTIASDTAALTVCHPETTMFVDELLAPQFQEITGYPIHTSFSFDEDKLIVGFHAQLVLPTFWTSMQFPGLIWTPRPPSSCAFYSGTSLIETIPCVGPGWGRVNLGPIPERAAGSFYAKTQLDPATAISRRSFSFTLTGEHRYWEGHSGTLRLWPIERRFWTQGGCDAPPIITRQPVSLAACPAGNASFSVTASGSAPIFYQWQFQGGDIPGATDPSLVIQNLGPEHLGDYSVVVRNQFGTVSSSGAELTFGAIPSLTLENVRNAQEPCSEGAFVIRRSCSSGTLVVHYSVSGTASPTLDYQPLEGTITIPDGQDSGYVYVLPIADQLSEAQETVVVTLTPRSEYAITGPSSATVLIAEDEPVLRSGFADDEIPRGDEYDDDDDDSSDSVYLGFSVNLGQRMATHAFVNKNGNITFDKALEDYDPVDLSKFQNIIAPFWADVDTTDPSTGPVEFGTGIIEGRPAFAVTWRDVGRFQAHGDLKNTFQMVIISRNDCAPGDFDLEFNYSKVKWDSGDAVGGTPQAPARAGFCVGGNLYELPYSGVAGAFLDSEPTGLRHNSLGTCKPGRYVFQFRGGQPVRLPSVVFTPASGPDLPVSVTLEAPGHPDARIFYTLDGSTPTRLSAVYTSPLTISANTLITAVASKVGLADGPLSFGIFGLACPTPEGVCAWWPAESTMEDNTGRHNGNRLIPQVSLPSFVQGKVGNAFSFVPTGNVGSPISVLDHERLRLNDAATIEAWIKPNVLNDNTERIILARGSQNSSGFVISVRPKTPFDPLKAELCFNFGGTSHIAEIPTDAEYHHFAAVYDNTASQQLRIFIDGVESGASGMSVGASADTWLTIGAQTDGTLPFSGAIDELAIYSRPLMPFEVNCIFSAGSHGKLPFRASITRPKMLDFGFWAGGWNWFTSVEQGGRADLAVFAEGTGLAYRWYRDGTLLSETQTPSLTIGSATGADEGIYTVTAVNAHGLSSSLWSYLQVIQPPIITLDPQDQHADEGGSVTFTVAAAGTEPFWYEWYYSDGVYDSLIGQGSEPYLTLENVQLWQAGEYYAIVYNNNYSWSAQSGVASLTVTPDEPPVIVTQPQSQTVLDGGNATFNVVANGSPTLAYQWQFNGADIPGATSSSLLLNGVQSSQAGNYNVIVRNGAGAVPSAVAVLTIANPVAPVIISQPIARAAIVGSDVTFKVQALSAPPTTYQWRRNGTPITGATVSSLVLHDVLPGDAGNYSVVIQNAFGSTTSSDAALRVAVVPLPPVAIISDQSDTFPKTVKLVVSGYPDAVIHYTLDGSVPTPSSSAYSEPLVISSATTVYAYATKPNYLNSGYTSTRIGDPSAPKAEADIFTVVQDDPATVLDVIANDELEGESSLATIYSLVQPANGTVIVGAGGSVLTYKPNPAFFGIDAFTYFITDSVGKQAAATCTVFVRKQDNANPNSFEASSVLAPGSTAATIEVQSIGDDPDGDQVAFYAVEPVPLGNFTVANGRGAVLYNRSAGVYCTVESPCVVTDGKGGAGFGTIIISDADQDNDRVPDAWEIAHGLNPEVDDSSGDSDNDGLPNIGEYELHTNPAVADNPLDLSGIAIPASLSGLISIPLTIGQDVEGDAAFTLFVDGKMANARVCKRSAWNALLDTTTIPNGPHTLSLRYNSESSGDLYGDSKSVNIANALTFTVLNSTFCDLLILDATVNNGASSYSASIYDALTYDPEVSDPLTTLTGTIVDNHILVSWNLTDASGTPLTSGPLVVDFTLTTAGDPGTPMQVAGTERVVRYYGKYLKNPYNSVFAVAWGQNSGKQRGWQAAFNSMFSKNVVDILALVDPDYVVVPYKAGGGISLNYNMVGAGTSFCLKDKQTKRELLDSLKRSGNFLWSGHGNPKAISSKSFWGVRITAEEISRTLKNGPETFEKPYKLVILQCCSAYSKEWADAFGVADFEPPREVPFLPGSGETETSYLAKGRSKETVASYSAKGKIPQAFVAWPVNTYGSGSLADIANFDGPAFKALFESWQVQGRTITECMEGFAAYYVGNQPPGSVGLDGILVNKTWCLSGCRDLTTNDRNP